MNSHIQTAFDSMSQISNVNPHCAESKHTSSNSSHTTATNFHNRQAHSDYFLDLGPNNVTNVQINSHIHNTHPTSVGQFSSPHLTNWDSSCASVIKPYPFPYYLIPSSRYVNDHL